MKIGVTIHATDEFMNPVDLAREAEARNFHSLYLPEHTHIPTSRETPAPTGTPELGREYLRTLDPYIALAAVSAATSRILLGTGIALVAQHDPIVLAKEIATLGKHRGVRVLPVYGGVGYGPQIEALEAGIHVVVGTPGRILDHLGNGRMDLSGVRVLVLDEAFRVRPGPRVMIGKQ